MPVLIIARIAFVTVINHCQWILAKLPCLQLYKPRLHHGSKALRRGVKTTSKPSHFLCRNAFAQSMQEFRAWDICIGIHICMHVFISKRIFFNVAPARFSTRVRVPIIQQRACRADYCMAICTIDTPVHWHAGCEWRSNGRNIQPYKPSSLRLTFANSTSTHNHTMSVR
jgi:hypothetical protein